MIKHIWFDFAGTLAILDKQMHDELRYRVYAEVVKKPLNQDLIEEYNEKYKKYHSNSAVFRNLGLPVSFWSGHVDSINPSIFYSLADKNIPEILLKLKKFVPISLLTNVNTKRVFPVIGLKTEWFSHIIQAGMLKEPKPNPEGFRKIIELTKEFPENILYVGDSVGKDIKPAKAVGMQTCLLWSKSPEADYSATKFEELLNIVK